MQPWQRSFTRVKGDNFESEPVHVTGPRELHVIIKAIRPLDDEVVREIAEKVSRAYQRDVAAEVQIDPSLLGGLVVLIGNRVVDLSLASQLQGISQAISRRLQETFKSTVNSWELPLEQGKEEFLAAVRRKVLAGTSLDPDASAPAATASAATPPQPPAR